MEVGLYLKNINGVNWLMYDSGNGERFYISNIWEEEHVNFEEFDEEDYAPGLIVSLTDMPPDMMSDILDDIASSGYNVMLTEIHTDFHEKYSNQTLDVPNFPDLELINTLYKVNKII